MRILVALNHPAHYYLFKYSVRELLLIGYTIIYVIKEKDVLEDLLISEKVEYIKIAQRKERLPNAFSILSNGFIELMAQNVNLLSVVIRWKPHLMIGTDISITHIGTLLRIPSFVFNEDDYNINKIFCKLSYPFSTRIVSPETCSVGPYEKKKIPYNGIQKMAYLHPDYFTPDRSLIEGIIGTKEKYFLIRLVSLTSGHDIEGIHTGLTESIIDSIIKLLQPEGRIFITNEGKLPKKYESLRLKIEVNKMHHILAHASIFIGDSQTMCAESGLLGTPFIRFNDFVGKIAYLSEIEDKYQLGFGIPTSQPDKVIEKVKEILATPNIKELWEERCRVIFSDKVDVAKFFSEIIVNHFIKKNEY